jgi:hypothetical protein
MNSYRKRWIYKKNKLKEDNEIRIAPVTYKDPVAFIMKGTSKRVKSAVVKGNKAHFRVKTATTFIKTMTVFNKTKAVSDKTKAMFLIFQNNLLPLQPKPI